MQLQDNVFFHIMMKYILSLSLFILAAHSQIIAQSADETAIKNLLEAETKAFCNVSLAEVCQKYWILDDKTVMNVSMPDGTHLQFKKADILDETNAPPENHATFTDKDFEFRIEGNIAFVTYTQTAALADGSRICSHEMRFLEKVNGEWKLHCSSVHQYIPRD